MNEQINGPVATCKAVLHLIRDISIRVDTDEYHKLFAAKELLVSAIRRANIDPRLENEDGRPIEELQLSKRAENCLKAERIFTIEQLVKFKEYDLLRMPNLGRISIEEIKRHLSGINEKLKGQP